MPLLSSLRELNHEQRHTVLASFLGWTLDVNVARRSRTLPGAER